MATWKALVPAMLVVFMLFCIYLKGDSCIEKLAVSKPTHRSIKRNKLNQTRFVLVTAADRSQFRESRDSVASMQKNLPQHKILFYDLGLRGPEAQEVSHWCGVTLVKFNFSRYPAWIRNLRTYSWKPLIIQEVLRANPGAIWFDASVRVKCPTLMTLLGGTLEKSGIALVDNTGHSSFATTDQRTYKHLPVNITMLKQKQMIGASFIAINNNNKIQENIFKKWVNCSLIRECIAPVGTRVSCGFKANRFTQFANCHRYDQSAINILLVNYFKGNVSAYWNKEAKRCVSVERRPTSHFPTKKC